MNILRSTWNWVVDPVGFIVLVLFAVTHYRRQAEYKGTERRKVDHV